jgi:hypothetical protein
LAPKGTVSGIKEGAASREKFIDSVQFVSHLANIGDAITAKWLQLCWGMAAIANRHSRIF